MIYFISLAVLGGIMISLSRQLNGRLSMSTGAMMASFWNHVVGFLVLTALGIGGAFVFQTDLGTVPLWAWLGGPVGVIFIAAGSWLIVRIGATATALMVISGQMVGGVVLDMMRGTERSLLLDGLGIALMLAGVTLSVLRKQND
ncbi:DMT family transporter [Roseicitreum antarcticum]|uniref:Transporter family-2 protein n=1 Tax=Roseicitreum antarcticum TaxID=564137 RepID=A0A1H2TIJ3_9RHOB|nr:DMT family transporter [Roseicitreum antarcticum]SDW43826.1 transporter family-2 protein [Roseicitreum antarcticum]